MLKYDEEVELTEEPIASPEPEEPFVVPNCECFFCGSGDIAHRGDGKHGFECRRCESVLVFGAQGGIVHDSGVIRNISGAQNLASELPDIDVLVIEGPFRGNAALQNIPEITLPTIAGVAIAAQKAGYRIADRTQTTIFLTKE